jgi:hypothetical protein
MKKILPLAAIVAALAFAAPAAAGPPNHDAALNVSPAAPVVDDSLVFSGCGYTPNVGVTVVVEGPSATSWFQGAVADGDGCFTTDGAWTYVAQDAGDYQALVYQSRVNKADATLSFTVST